MSLYHNKAQRLIQRLSAPYICSTVFPTIRHQTLINSQYTQTRAFGQIPPDPLALQPRKVSFISTNVQNPQTIAWQEVSYNQLFGSQKSDKPQATVSRSTLSTRSMSKADARASDRRAWAKSPDKSWQKHRDKHGNTSNPSRGCSVTEYSSARSETDVYENFGVTPLQVENQRTKYKIDDNMLSNEFYWSQKFMKDRAALIATMRFEVRAALDKASEEKELLQQQRAQSIAQEIAQQSSIIRKTTKKILTDIKDASV